MPASLKSKKTLVSPVLSANPGQIKTAKRASGLKKVPSIKAATSRLEQITRLAITLFEGNKAAALLWINSPHGVLDNKTPAELSKSQQGTLEVVNLIGRLEHGVFS